MASCSVPFRHKISRSIFFFPRGRSDIVALVSLFEYDHVFECHPVAFLEVKATRFDRFQKNLVQARKVSYEFFDSCNEIVVYADNVIATV